MLTSTRWNITKSIKCYLRRVPNTRNSPIDNTRCSLFNMPILTMLPCTTGEHGMNSVFVVSVLPDVTRAHVRVGFGFDISILNLVSGTAVKKNVSLLLLTSK